MPPKIGDMMSQPERAVLSLLLALLPSLAVCGPSHCTDDEEVVFSCSLQRSGKVVSICSSRNLLASQGNGQLSYRFGAIGAVELEFPDEKSGSPEKFLYSHYFRARTDRTQLSFRSGDYTYAVFDVYEDDGEPIKTSGVSVSGGNPEKFTELKCAAGKTAQWYLIDGAVPCDAGDDPSACNYKRGR